MADDPGTDAPPVAPPVAPSAAPPPPPAAPPAAPPTTPPAATLDLAGVMDAVNSIPERVADAIREATPPPRTRSGGGETAKTEAAPTETAIAPARKGFADWWFTKS